MRVSLVFQSNLSLHDLQWEINLISNFTDESTEEVGSDLKRFFMLYSSKQNDTDNSTLQTRCVIMEADGWRGCSNWPSEILYCTVTQFEELSLEMPRRQQRRDIPEHQQIQKQSLSM